MALSDRKKRILRSLVDDYIASASPVSSKEIQKKYLKDCSSATIRNELSALESMGFLMQPHTSAGRVPSTKAFRFYVDQLMEATPLDEQEIGVIEEHFNKKVTTIEEIMENTAKVLAKITHYPSVAVGEFSRKEVLKNIRLIRINNSEALVLIVTNAHVIKDATIEVNENVTNQILDEAANWMNKLFVGKTVGELKKINKSTIRLNKDFKGFRKVFDDVIELLIKVSDEKREIYAAGGSQMLEYPEYNDIERAKQFLAVIEKKEDLVQLFDDDATVEMSVKIGKEEDEKIPEGCALVTAKFGLKDESIGNAAVIGPVRMDYQKVVSVMDHISKLIEKILSGQEE